MFNLFSGVLAPTAGQIVFLGQRIDGLSPRAIARLGMSRTFQHVRLLPDMSVLENVAIGAHARGKAGLLRSMLHWSAKKKPRCSPKPAPDRTRGPRRRPAHRRQPAAGPAAHRRNRPRAVQRSPLLLLDEPAAGLRYGEAGPGDLLEQLRGEGLGVLLVEHDMDFVMGLADRSW
jgi:branched-chain amino acid transport system permease protein